MVIKIIKRKKTCRKMARKFFIGELEKIIEQKKISSGNGKMSV